MIAQFTVENFKSIRQPAELSLLEANITEFPETLIRSKLDGIGVLPAVLLYGANGSGKSNVLKALDALMQILHQPETAMKQSYGFYGSEKEDTAFDLLVRNDEHEYEYVLRIREGNVTEETLYARTLTDTTYDVVFDRDPEGVFLGEGLEELDVSPLTEDMPMMTFVMAQAGTHVRVKEVAGLLEGIRLVDCSRLDDAPVVEALHTGKVKKSLVKMLSCVQSRITDLEAAKEGILVTQGKRQLPIEELGKGLQQMVRLYATAALALEKGECLLLDDVNQKLHPKAFRFFLELFTNQKVNTAGAQLLGTSYDMPTMANSVLRRDEIWMTAANEAGETTIYPLALFLKENGEKVRKDETYFKQFLEGRYGTDVVPVPYR